jgi:DNA-binding LytR/AlgR family response regulator
MTRPRPTALIADDEPLLRDELADMLRLAWPDLQVVTQARNGREAVELQERWQPDICFLDVHMPGLSGLDAARAIGRQAHLVFVTAFDQYALEAFDHGILDYLVKPIQVDRLAETVGRLQERLRLAQPVEIDDDLLRALAARLDAPAAPRSTLRWLRASSGQTLHLIPVDQIDFLQSDAKYTIISWRAAGAAPSEAVLRMPLKELLAQLDPEQFVQVHRSAAVNLQSVAKVVRTGKETAELHLKQRSDVLPVSRHFLQAFKTM